MIRKVLLSTVFAATAGAAVAADLPSTKGPAPFVAPPVFTWTGFYVGLNAGGTWANSNHQTIGVAPMRISHVVNGSRPVTAELALLFGRAFGQAPQYWLNLQSAYDLKIAERTIGKRLKAVSELLPA